MPMKAAVGVLIFTLPMLLHGLVLDEGASLVVSANSTGSDLLLYSETLKSELNISEPFTCMMIALAVKVIAAHVAHGVVIHGAAVAAGSVTAHAVAVSAAHVAMVKSLGVLCENIVKLMEFIFDKIDTVADEKKRAQDLVATESAATCARNTEINEDVKEVMKEGGKTAMAETLSEVFKGLTGLDPEIAEMIVEIFVAFVEYMSEVAWTMTEIDKTTSSEKLDKLSAKLAMMSAEQFNAVACQAIHLAR
eukprot:TRINITY_DN61401_c0_g1_i1.p1 TRINITY_DN61401_c0_g1~~TRINITY_DN61401_c0_g1_i1.p1  ORF type:complete len:249 (-),score=49.59 TRINITY_DN61401_c0_g1_i1:119-865(-)